VAGHGATGFASNHARQVGSDVANNRRALMQGVHVDTGSHWCDGVLESFAALDDDLLELRDAGDDHRLNPAQALATLY